MSEEFDALGISLKDRGSLTTNQSISSRNCGPTRIHHIRVAVEFLRFKILPQTITKTFYTNMDRWCK
ncbi:MAG: hypothetical protein CM1200mP15_16660 [Dehalococcoidia bacterium]|nr:MAG: hypothetical protein CM1200mP15_16660 [Dehalococcoidia bacterium]